MTLNRFVLALIATFALAACGGSGGSSDDPVGSTPPGDPAPDPDPDPEDPVFETAPDPEVDVEAINLTEVSVHDPSIFRDDEGRFHVVGSHMAMASTDDLMVWEQAAPGINPITATAAEADSVFGANPLFSNYPTEVAEGIDWTFDFAGSWASDVIQLDDGRFYFYYNHCTNSTGVCDAPRSYLGVAVSDNVMGPYENLGIFLRSGQTDEEMAMDEFNVGGLESFDASIHPNTIDPHAFFDAEGNFWMVYGSFSGGIFILEMDPETGMPVPGQGYGTHLAGGDHASIEGGYMLYSPETEYYYLFVSFGGFAQQDGYNMRIARSRNPDGPFLDAEGQDMVNARGNFDSIEPFGVKIMGGFVFESEVGSGAESRGYMSPGHNSAYFDEQTGEYFLIHHTRFPDTGEAHNVRVHEMFMTEDGWLTASPHRYVTGIEGENIVDFEDVVGDYQFINHHKDINTSPHLSQDITLTAEGEVLGEVTGSYELFPEQPNRILLSLDDLGEFEGQLRWQWNAQLEQLVPVFSAVSEQGVSVWGSQLPAMNNAELLTQVADALNLPETFKGSQLDLPTEGARGASIDWQTDNPSLISTDGQANRPNVGMGDQTVRLTATVSRQGAQEIRDFNIILPEREPLNRVASFEFEGDLSESLGNFDAGQGTGDRIWKTGEGSVAFVPGAQGQALELDGTSGVRLAEGLIKNNEYTVSLWLNPTAITQFTTALFGAVNEQIGDDGNPFSNSWISLVPESWDGNTMLWSGSNPFFDGSAGVRIPEGDWSHLAFSVDRGLVKVFIDGQEMFSGGGQTLTDFFTGETGIFALGVNYWDTPFNGLIDELRVYEAALSQTEINALDIDQLPESDLLNLAVSELNLGDLSNLQEDFPLPQTGAFASAISWTSSDPSVVAIEGATAVVNRPSGNNAQVSLEADITLNGQTASKTFEATVVGEGGLVTPLALFDFNDNLLDAQANFGQGSVTGNRLDNTGGTLAFAPGVEGQALDLDGTYGVKLPDNLITDDSYTVSLWLNPRQITAFTPAFFGAASTESWISVVPSGPVEDQTMLWSGTDWFDGVTGQQIPTNQWTHFVAVNNSGSLTLYLDGEQVFTGDGFPDVFTPAATAEFGVGVNFWDTPFNGLVDQVAIYDLPLSADDVQALSEAANN